MNRFYLKFLSILALLASGYFYPAFAYNSPYNNGALSNDNSTNESTEFSQQSPALLDNGSGQSNNQDGGGLWSNDTQASVNGNLMKAPPPGVHGDPIGGVAPVGHGFLILLGLSFIYLLCILMFQTMKKMKMNKTWIAFFILLAASLSKAYGQAPPDGSRRIFKEDFGGKGASYPTVLTLDTIPHTWTTTCTFVGPGGGTGTNGAANDNEYQMAKWITAVPTATVKGGIAYAAWWSDTNPPPFQDHTFQSDPTQPQGYMMVINAAADPKEFFRYTINGLCPNTQLYFSAWVGNLIRDINTYASRLNPILRFVILDPSKVAPNDTLAATPFTDLITVPKTTLTATNNGWNQYGLSFTNGGAESIELVIYNAQNSNNGNDLVLDDIEVWLKLPVINGISGSRYYCKDEPMNLTLDYSDPNHIFLNPGVEWLYSENEQSLPAVIDNNTDWSAWTPVSYGQTCTATMKEGYYVAVVGDASLVANGDYHCCAISEEIKISPKSTTDVLYWKQHPNNQNWNDSTNWLVNGVTPAPYAPSGCTNVHIPGNSDWYPTLDYVPGATCSCHNIWFHFGGMIGQPQLLQYDSAYVQYNFGKSNGTNADIYSTVTPMSRGRLYALAAPLKKVASGDFNFYGYPTMYQERFKTTHQPGEYGVLGTSGDFASWYQAENVNGWVIANQYNAIAVGTDSDTPDLTKGLEALNGILEIPYYNNPAITQYLNGFSQFGTVSYFQYYYYDIPGIPLINPSDSTPGSIDRGSGDAYKFIFDGNLTTEGTRSVYTMTGLPSGVEILIGNPFMSNLDFNAFATDNPGVDKYRLFINSNFSAYSNEAGSGTDMRYIAPLQAFIITPPTSVLKFYLDEAVAPDPINSLNLLKSSTDDTGGKADVLYLKATNKFGVSWLTLSMQNTKATNLNLLMPDICPEVPQIYATDATGQKNAIQFEGKYVNSVPLGLLSSTTDPVTLTVYNKDKLAVDHLFLYDKYLNKKVDWLASDTYTFTNVPGEADRFLLMTVDEDIDVNTGIAPAAADRPVNVGSYDNVLFVNATSGIEEVTVMSLQGITVSRDRPAGQLSFTKTLQLPAGMYLVSVKIKTGATKVAKILVK